MMLRRARIVAVGGLAVVTVFWVKAQERPDIFRHWFVLVFLIGLFGGVIYLAIAAAVRNISVALYRNEVVWKTLSGKIGRCLYSEMTIQEIQSSAGACYRIGRPDQARFTVSDMIEGHAELIAELRERSAATSRPG